MIVTGDSIALGLAPYLHAPVVARVGIGSRAGTAMIRRIHARDLVVDLGVNDDQHAVSLFARRIHLVLEGRRCVVWLTMRHHRWFNSDLRLVARHDDRLRVISGIVPTVDGTHPTASGYRVLAGRVRIARAGCPDSPARSRE